MLSPWDNRTNTCRRCRPVYLLMLHSASAMGIGLGYLTTLISVRALEGTSESYAMGDKNDLGSKGALLCFASNLFRRGGVAESVFSDLQVLRQSTLGEVELAVEGEVIVRENAVDAMSFAHTVAPCALCAEQAVAYTEFTILLSLELRIRVLASALKSFQARAPFKLTLPCACARSRDGLGVDRCIEEACAFGLSA